MTGLDLTAAIAAAEKALRADRWLSIAIMSGTAADVYRAGSKLAIEAALPEIREQRAKQIEAVCEPLDRTAFREGAEWAASIARGLVRGGTTGGESWPLNVGCPS